jgi:hypothetical protein
MNQSIQPKEVIPMSEADAFREYIDVIRPPDPPRASIKDIELLSQTIAIRIWAMRTNHDLATVLAAGYFDDVKDVRLRKEDRIEIVASWEKPVAEHATLVVMDADKYGLAHVALLHKFERRQ